MSLKLSSPWTTRRMLYKENQSHTFYPSPRQPAQFKCGSTSSSKCVDMGAQDPPLSATILPLRGSAWSVPCTSSRSYGPIPFKLEQPDSALSEDVRTPSLRSVGAMAMHLANVPDWTLMAIGWWRSLVFVVCIQQQISSFSAGVSVQMSWQPWFQHT